VAKNPKRPKKPKSQEPPSREQLLAFIQERGGGVTKRDIVRHFRLDAVGKRELNAVMREMRGEGRLGGKRKRVHVPGELPAVVVADITTRDDDGELIATPAEWDEEEHGAAPRIRLEFGRRPDAGPAPGIGDRVLVRTEKNEPTTRQAIRGASCACSKRHAHRRSAFSESSQPAADGCSPSTRKSLGRELSILPGAEGNAEDGDLVSVDVLPQRSFGFRPRASASAWDPSRANARSASSPFTSTASRTSSAPRLWRRLKPPAPPA
jgi:ribonuclease R